MVTRAHDIGEPGAVTILIPHYQTLDSIRLCLRSLRRYTSYPCRVVVLDQGSTDASIDYLRSVRWISLREIADGNDRRKSHYRSLNRGVADVETPYFLTLHSDVYFHRHGWLSFLVDSLEAGGHAAVGSRHQAIPVTTAWNVLYRSIRNRRVRETAGAPRLRSVCTLYRTSAFREAGCRFYQRADSDVSYGVSKSLLERGYSIEALPSTVLGRYIFHESATTRIANSLYEGRSLEKHLRAHRRYRRRSEVQAVLHDATLDQ